VESKLAKEVVELGLIKVIIEIHFTNQNNKDALLYPKIQSRIGLLATYPYILISSRNMTNITE
jgi:hypothetical protein